MSKSKQKGYKDWTEKTENKIKTVIQTRASNDKKRLFDNSDSESHSNGSQYKFLKR